MEQRRKRGKTVHIFMRRLQIIADNREFKCEGFKSTWNEKKFVVEHSIQNTKAYFCLNCED